jgi:hypothetical protein
MYELDWYVPQEMRDGSHVNMIYVINNIDSIPNDVGVYVFCRQHGENVSPLYIGKALNLRVRIGQQLNNCRLMNCIFNAPAGSRHVHFAVLRRKKNLKRAEAVKVVERGLIRAAMSEGHELFNVHGTKPRYETISSFGARVLDWLPSKTIKLL